MKSTIGVRKSTIGGTTRIFQHSMVARHGWLGRHGTAKHGTAIPATPCKTERKFSKPPGGRRPRTPRSELSRFAPGPRAPSSQEKQHPGKQNRKRSNQKYKNNKPMGAGAKRPPHWSAAEGGTLWFLLFLIAFLMMLLAGMLFFLGTWGPGPWSEAT